MGEWLGLLRSLVLYWRPGRQRGLRRMYAPLVREGDLVFDIGAHLGDRSLAFAALGARVVAFEPQPFVARWLRRILRDDPRITVRTEAVGREIGTARMTVSTRHPTVSTMSGRWRGRVAEGNPGFGSVSWDRSLDVRVVTLDALIEEYGMPSFCKIDVEGHEPEVLAGLSSPLPAVSFEFVTGDLTAATLCVRRLDRLGRYEFNVVLGERRDFLWQRWRKPEAAIAWLSAGADQASSGDVYARLTETT